MRRRTIVDFIRRGVIFAAGGLAAAALAQEPPVRLEVDATDAARKILHARLQFPVHPGPLTLFYPKWIPGEHEPSGPIKDLSGLKMSALGQPVAWRRDDDDMFAFHLQVPAGADRLEVALDFLLPPSSGGFSSGASATAQLLVLSWNQVLLYPAGVKASDVKYSASLRMPAGWKFASALPAAGGSAPAVSFATMSLETLVDSPVIMGTWLRTIDLTPGQHPGHTLNLVSDSAAALELKPEDTRHFAHLVAETGALFGARHYGSYHFLLTLSDHVAHFGLEHHESSDDREGEQYLTDGDYRNEAAYLLCHEMVHSWNGKYRRPAGMATPDFQKPVKGELLWVYEGLTDYLGIVLTARSGLWTNGNFQDYVALEAARLDHTPGREWRPLADTAIAAQLLYEAREEQESSRRSVDFYEEGDLIWLEADVLIRQKTGGAKSLDDFCRKFHGGESGPPKVVPYTEDDVVAALNEVAPNDWREFFRARVYEAAPRAPLGGIEGSGWRLTYTNTVSPLLKSRESQNKYTDLRYSLGFIVKEEGGISDVIAASPADQAGVGTGMKLLGVNGRHWTPEILREAVKAASTDAAPVELLLENEEYFKTCQINYHGGEKYPLLERDSSKPDLLSQILKPLTPEPDLK
jgi:predicted metalloprotease with PDZ domain